MRSGNIDPTKKYTEKEIFTVQNRHTLNLTSFKFMIKENQVKDYLLSAENNSMDICQVLIMCQTLSQGSIKTRSLD